MRIIIKEFNKIIFADDMNQKKLPNRTELKYGKR